VSYKVPSDALWEAQQRLSDAHPNLSPEQQAQLDFQDAADDDLAGVARRRTVATWRAVVCGVLLAAVVLGPMPVRMTLRCVIGGVLIMLVAISLADARRANALLKASRP
jgi:hypothetical protein